MVISYPRLRLPSSIARLVRFIRVHSPPLNFITLHYAYFIGVCLIASIIFWGSSKPARSVSYCDSLFLVVSAMTLAGLNTINLSQLNTFQQFILFVLIILGSAIWVSIAVVHIRRKAFERKFQDIVEANRQRRRARSSSRLSLQRSRSQNKPEISIEPPGESATTTEKLSLAEDGEAVASRGEPDASPSRLNPQDQRQQVDQVDGETGHPISSLTIDTGISRRITFASLNSPVRERQHARILAMQGVGARHNIYNHPRQTPRPIYPDGMPTSEKGTQASDMPHSNGLPPKGNVGRNSQFAGLSIAERERLGGAEYQAVTILAALVPTYFVLWQLLGCLGLGAYVANNRASTARVNGENPWWVGAFNGVSAFNNSGMSLLDANMTAFNASDYTLITMGLLILAGNTCYPVFLRFIIWTLFKLIPDNERCHELRSTLRFLLDHPRRCYTNLFPSRHTWWLLATLISLNGIDWAAFEVLNIGNSTVTSLPKGARALDGLFQALAVRSGGFYVVAIPQLRISLLILYVIMMYISVYPVVITMRNSNVYEERSLGIYADDPQEKQRVLENNNIFGRIKRSMTDQTNKTESRGYFVRQQLRGQLAHDIWWIVLSVLFIVLTETSNFERDPVTYSVFNTMFEVVSAYGCVGISVGLPNEAYSFSGGWHKLSKLILCAVMLRGRHRGLPVAIDRAVLLPGEHLAAAEEEDAQIRLERTATTGRDVV